MDLWQLMLILLRRWFVVIPVLLITGFVAWDASARVDPTYTASATGLVLVENPAERGNPSTERAAQAATVSLTSLAARQQLADAGLASDYSISVRNRTSLVDVFVETGDPQLSAATVQAVLDLFPAEFAGRPQIYGAPPGPRITVELLAGPAVEGAAYDGRTRVIAVVVAVGLVMAVLLAVLVDLLLRSLRRRRLANVSSSSTALDVANPPDDGMLTSHGSERARAGSSS